LKLQANFAAFAVVVSKVVWLYDTVSGVPLIDFSQWISGLGFFLASSSPACISEGLGVVLMTSSSTSPKQFKIKYFSSQVYKVASISKK